MKKLLFGVILISMHVNANAVEWFTGKLTRLSASSFPYTVFYMDAGSLSCPVGHYLNFETPTDPNKGKVAYAALLSALIAQKSVYISVAEPEGNGYCRVNTIDVLQ